MNQYLSYFNIRRYSKIIIRVENIFENEFKEFII